MARQGKGGGGGQGGRRSRGGGGSGGGSSGASANAIRAGAAFVELFTKDSLLVRGLKAASDKVKAWSQSIQKMGIGMLAGGAAILAPITAALKGVLDRGAELNRLSQVYGDTVENISALMYAADRSGAGAERLKNAMENLPERINDAATGAGEIAKSFIQLGISAQDLKGMSFTEQLMAIADGMASISNTTERAALASKLFSDVGLEGMIPLLSKGSGQLRAWLKEAKQVGAVMSSEDAMRSAEVSGILLKVWTALSSTFEAVGIAMEKVLILTGKYVDPLVNALGQVREFIKNNQLLVGTIAAVGAALVAGGIAFIGLGTVLGIVAAAFSSIATAIKLIVSPIGLIIAKITVAIAVLGTMAVLGTALWLKFSDSGKQTARDFKDAWDALTTAVQEGNLEGAVKLVTATINLEWVRLTNGIKGAWQSMLAWLREATVAWGHFIASHWAAIRNVIAGGLTRVGEGLGLLPAGSTAESAKASREELKRIQDDAIEQSRQIAAQRQANEAERERKLKEARDEFNKAVENAKVRRREQQKQLEEIPKSASLPIGTAVRGGFQFGNASQFFGGSNSYQQQQLKQAVVANEKLEAIRRALDTIPIARL